MILIRFAPKTFTNRAYAICTGSFASFVEKKVKTFNDIDIFILVNPLKSPGLYQKILQTLIVLNKSKITHPYLRTSKRIMYVCNVGKLQFILINWFNCICHFHIDRLFFTGFHFITRYRLLVIRGKNKDILIPKYIPSRKEEGIIAEYIPIPEHFDKKKYPGKHIENVKNLEPPSLYQQCFDKLLSIDGYCHTAQSSMKTKTLDLKFSPKNIEAEIRANKLEKIVISTDCKRITYRL